MGRAEDNKRDKRHRILTAARDLFRTQGYDATSMDAIAARAGVSKGSVFFHARSKAALLNQVFQIDMSTWIEEAFDAPPLPDLLEDLTNRYAALLQAMCAHPELTRVYMTQVAFADDEHERATDAMQLLSARTVALIDLAKSRGQLDPDAATDKLAYNLFALYFIQQLRWLGGAHRITDDAEGWLRDVFAVQLVPLLQPGPTRDTARRSARQPGRRLSRARPR